MIKKNILGLLLLFTTLCTFNSCEVEDDEFYDFEQDFVSYIWSETYENDKGEDVYHELSFEPNGTGYDYYEYSWGEIPTGSEKKLFRWDWARNRPYSVDIYYNSGERTSLDDIHIVGYSLFAIWDNADLEFRGVWK